MDLGDFASLLKGVAPTLSEMEVAHMFMELVDLDGRLDVGEWLQVLSLYEAGLGGRHALRATINACMHAHIYAYLHACKCAHQHVSIIIFYTSVSPFGKRTHIHAHEWLHAQVTCTAALRSCPTSQLPRWTTSPSTTKAEGMTSARSTMSRNRHRHDECFFFARLARDNRSSVGCAVR